MKRCRDANDQVFVVPRMVPPHGSVLGVPELAMSSVNRALAFNERNHVDEPSVGAAN